MGSWTHSYHMFVLVRIGSEGVLEITGITATAI